MLLKMNELWKGRSGKLQAAFEWPLRDLYACGSRLLNSARNGEEGAGD
jgi:hypothetical protein